MASVREVSLIILVWILAMGAVSGVYAQQVNDEPEGALLLNPWAPRIHGSGEGATYSNADRWPMKIVFPGSSWGGGNRGGGSLWYRWTSPVTGTATVSGSREARLFLNYRELLMDNGRVSLPVVLGQTYLFAVVCPTHMFGPGDFGLGFWFDFRIPIPEMVQILWPEPSSEHRTGDTIPLKAALLQKPEGFDSVVFLIGGDTLGGTSPPKSANQEPFTVDWVPEMSGDFTLMVGIRLTDGALIAVTDPRPIRILPRNDHFKDREALTGTRVEIQGSTRLASLDPGERSLTGKPGARSIWWSWLAPFSGTVSLSFPDCSPGSLVAYSGESLDTLIPVSRRQSCSNIVFSATEGNAYSLAFEMADPEYFLSRFTLDLVPDPTGLRITKMIPVADGVDVEVQGAAGRDVTILVSPDLRAWEPVATVKPDTNDSARLHVAIPGVSGASETRFVRATAQPVPAKRVSGEDTRSMTD